MLRKDSIIVIASGRNMDGMVSVGYKEQIRPDAVIHMNGTRVVAGDELLYEHFMDKELLFMNEDNQNIPISSINLENLNSIMIHTIEGIKEVL